MGNTSNNMRTYHRYLGFFLAGIMAIYAVSGMLLIFRNTDFLKVDKTRTETLAKDIKPEELGRALRIREFAVEKSENGILYFKQGQFDTNTGIATIRSKELPTALDKLTKIHKANTNSPLFFLNLFFGASLLFFVVSAFWMFMPGTDIFKKGLYFALAGAALVVLMVLV